MELSQLEYQLLFSKFNNYYLLIDILPIKTNCKLSVLFQNIWIAFARTSLHT